MHRIFILLCALLLIQGCQDNESDTGQLDGQAKTVAYDDLVHKGGVSYDRVSNEPYSGEVSGALQGKMVDGKWEGKVSSYYENGQLKWEGNHVSNKLDGTSRFWNEDGQLETEISYVNYRMHGPLKRWHENGRLASESSYVNGKNDGLARNWYPNGQLQQESYWANDRANGPIRAWHENGQLIKEGYFVNHKGEGLFKVWDENGKLKEVTCVSNGAPVEMHHCEWIPGVMLKWQARGAD